MSNIFAMKTAAILLAFVFVVCTIHLSVAQENVKNFDPKTSSPENKETKTRKTSATHAGSEAQTPQQKDSKSQIYVGADWPIGAVVLRNGTVLDRYNLRYNFLTDRIQYIAGKDTLTFIDPDDISSVTFGGHTFIYETYQYDSIIKRGYFELIVPGKNKLMLRRLVTGRKPDPKYPGDESLARYQVDECYFISKPGLPAQKLACNRKSALTFLNDHNEDIHEYLRITGNKVRTIDDLKLLVSYYNSLDE